MRPSIPIFAAVSLQTNSRCNLKCPFCFYGQHEGYGSDEIIATEVIERLFAQLAEIGFRGRVSLYNMNDPLTDPRMPELLATARRMLPSCVHHLSTNGLLLTQALLDNILRHLDSLRINRYGKPLPLLDFSHPRIDLQEKRGFYTVAANNRGGSLAALPGAAPPSNGPCANPFGQLVVMPPGVAVLCCSDGFQRVRVGDVRRESLLEIWQGERLQEVRDALTSGRRQSLELCRDCSVEGGGFLEYFSDPAMYHRMMGSVMPTVREGL